MNRCNRFRAGVVALAGWVCLVAACDTDDGEGTLRVNVYGEAFVEDSIPADEFVDGWELRFSKFLVSVSDVDADGTAIDGNGVYDLAVASNGSGHDFGEALMSAGTIGSLNYRIAPAAGADGGNATAEDIASMTDRGQSLWVEGQASKDGTVIGFSWGFSTDTRYVDCASTERVPDGDEATAQLTIHADHLLYDDLDSEEPNVAFDIIASADADSDGQVTEEELRQVDITGQTRYQVGSRDIADLWSFIAVQTTTVGHIDGEGHCEIETDL